MNIKPLLSHIENHLSIKLPECIAKNNLQPFEKIILFKPLHTNGRHIAIYPDGCQIRQNKTIRVFLEVNMPSVEGRDVLDYHDVIFDFVKHMPTRFESFNYALQSVESDFLQEQGSDASIIFLALEFEDFLNDCNK